MGHALGILGHTTVVGDIMHYHHYEQDDLTLNQNETGNIKKVYYEFSLL